ncbi:MAG: hypothetical protein PF961_09905 [Planctomycetota bacterium]|jgi:hypothetical protein|nr:hypothetical protein [Planctomycetota bacterium]
MADDDEPMNEKLGMWIGMAAVGIPAMIAAGFMPAVNVLPTAMWAVIAAAGAAVGGIIHAKKVLGGGIGGLAIGLGAFYGTYYYVDLRGLLIDSETYWSLELILGAGIGAIPGAVLFSFLTRAAATGFAEESFTDGDDDQAGMPDDEVLRSDDEVRRSDDEA